VWLQLLLETWPSSYRIWDDSTLLFEMVIGVNTKYDENGLLKFIILYYQIGDDIETFEIH